METTEKQKPESKYLINRLKITICGLERCANNGSNKLKIKKEIRSYQTIVSRAGDYAHENKDEAVLSALRNVGERYQKVLRVLKEKRGDDTIEGIIDRILNPSFSHGPIICDEISLAYWEESNSN